MFHRIIILFAGLMLCGCAPSLKEKAGQLVMAGFRGESVDEKSPVVRDIRKFNLGGVILFDVDVALGEPSRNIRSPEQLARLTCALQSAARVPLLIAIDQEGGRVDRLKPELGFPETSSLRELGEIDEVAFTYEKSLRLAGALNAAGINLNLAPVVDLAVNPDNFIVKKERTFSSDADAVRRHAAQFVRAHHDAGILCTLKHFPGHGSSAADSHLGLADVTATWTPVELEPYRQLCADADVVMTAHVFHRDLDPDWPATLSEKMINGLLRKEIGYQGVVMSDDLGMKAIADHYGFETAVERALNAGVDILLIANNTDYNPEAVQLAVQTIVRLVESGRVSEARVDEAYQRIQRLKTRL
ncbi:MAG: glycoside hydrolase family 3 [Kiritimatiellales bacterium]|nr:glycoside hydrolase family 3 [Kiritimatiellales bacterium]